MARLRVDRTELCAGPAGALLLAGVFAVYAPGLSGGFLLDDMVNLDALGRLGGIDGWAAFVDYVLGSHTGTGGRPVALLSFLLDGVDWPTAPGPFKYTNLMFHLLTTVGLIWLALELARALGYERREQYAIALLTGAAWGLHPYLVSTVLYVVQRMAILAALFVVFGLGCYVLGRRLLGDGRARAGYAWMTTGIAVFTPLAFLSKPNGGLLPVLALVLHATVLRRLVVADAEHLRFRLWHGVFLLLPTLTIAGYFVLNWQRRVLGGYDSRPFSLLERLLTEARILVDYAGHLLIPRIQTSGLYHDNYPISTGLLTPASTLFAVLVVIGLFVAAIALRRIWPVLSAALLFFFVGHALESTFIPLELYFEHRNYLPSMIAAFAVAAGLVGIWNSRAIEGSTWIAGITAAALITTLSTFTVARAQLWGDPARQALTWASENPGSVRAQQQAAIVYLRHGRPELAADHMASAIRHNPDSSLLRVQYLLASCAHGEYSEKRLDEAARAIGDNWFQSYTIEHIERLGDIAVDGSCPGLKTADVLRLADAALAHPGVRVRGSMVEQLQYVRGSLLLRADRPEEARHAFTLAVRAARNFEGAIQMAAVMATAGHYEYALELLDHAEADLKRSGPRLRDRLRQRAVDYHAEIERLRIRIRENARSRAPGVSASAATISPDADRSR